MIKTTCPQCGHEASGKFCSSCGATLGGSACSVCGTSVKTGVRFCHLCGSPVGSPMTATAHTGSRTPWLVAGAALVLLILVAVARSQMSSTPPTVPAPAAAARPAPAGGVPDIANMSARERANRLFNRVVAAAERGDSGEVAMFSPMAIQSYDMLGVLDTDARYDKGMILAVSANYPAALAQADTIEQSYPNHLLSRVIRATVAQRTGDDDGLARAYREFLAAFESETALNRSEYQAHQSTVEGFREDALRTGGSQ